MASPPLAEDFKTTPYWWEAAPRPEPAETELPAQADVVVVGSGVTGLQAALATARGGREALVIEAGLAGTGASTRNAGNVVPYLWAKHGWLEKKLGRAQAAALAAGGEAAQAYFIAFVEREQISCGLVPGNRYFLALTAKHFAHLKKDASVFDELGVSPPWVPISAAELRTETGLEGYHGAVAVRGSRPKRTSFFSGFGSWSPIVPGILGKVPR